MEFNKAEIIKTILSSQQATLEDLITSANVAKDAATAEESKAENKYDTRGLEASYLAGAQSKRVIELQESIYRITNLNLKTYKDEDTISSTAIVALNDGEQTKYFFLLPVMGGLQIPINGIQLQTLSVEAPLAREIIGKSVGDCFEFQAGDKKFEYEIVQVY